MSDKNGVEAQRNRDFHGSEATPPATPSKCFNGELTSIFGWILAKVRTPPSSEKVARPENAGARGFHG